MLNGSLHLNEHCLSPEPDEKTTRAGFSDAILELGKRDPAVVVLSADLAESTQAHLFQEKFPDHHIEVGIAEQNMAGIAAGLALSGKIPFMSSYAIFSPGRNWEQIRLAVCLTNANVKIVSTHCGLSACFDGGMSQCTEDIALTRVLPNLIVISPADYWETKKAILAAHKHKGPVYIRIGREATTEITTQETPFEIGKAYVVKEGNDALIISTGTVLYEALIAAKELKAKHNSQAAVINCPTIKPLDSKTILEAVAKLSPSAEVVTIEDHQAMSGFGSAITELLSEQHPIKVTRVGVPDTFGESGPYKLLKEKYGISSYNIVRKVLGY